MRHSRSDSPPVVTDAFPAENAENEYIAYVSEQNLLPDETGEPIRHPQVSEMFGALAGDRYMPKRERQH